MSEIMKLKYPVECNGEIINEIKLRRPKGKDMKNNEKRGAGQIEGGIYMIADLSGLDVSTVEELDVYDLNRIDEVVEGFLK